MQFNQLAAEKGMCSSHLAIARPHRTHCRFHIALYILIIYSLTMYTVRVWVDEVSAFLSFGRELTLIVWVPCACIPRVIGDNDYALGSIKHYINVTLGLG